jgi:protein TonB
MPRFLLASLGLHVAFLLPWMSVFQFAGHRETVLTVTLEAPEHAAAPAAASTPGRPVAEKKTVARDAPMALPAGSQATALVLPEPASDAGRERAAEDDDGKQSASARAQIQAQLLLDLRRYFEYPLLARRRGWEGTVLLSFVVESDGALRGIEIAHSSGYELLDNSALAAVRRVGRVSEAGRWLGGRSLEMDVPVIYQLKER